ncbi:MAG TPA: glucoamylase family protein, partial [Bryobacteraceae bacterium]|nr:glucoamylase family protein [Bryobacteraceae bacterium]
GFADSFNPQTRWVSPDVLGIDLGITLLSAENLRSGRVWNWFMQADAVEQAMGQVFRPAAAFNWQ